MIRDYYLPPQYSDSKDWIEVVEIFKNRDYYPNQKFEISNRIVEIFSLRRSRIYNVIYGEMVLAMRYDLMDIVYAQFNIPKSPSLAWEGTPFLGGERE